MTDLLVLLLGLSLGGWGLALAFSPLGLLAVLSAWALLGASVAFRRVGPLVGAVCVLAAVFTSQSLSTGAPRLWEALVAGMGLLALLEIGWDRARMVSANLGPRAYARRLAHLGRCALVSALVVLISALLGQATPALGLSPGPALALVIAVAATVVLTLVLLAALWWWRREGRARG